MQPPQGDLPKYVEISQEAVIAAAVVQGKSLSCSVGEKLHEDGGCEEAVGDGCLGSFTLHIINCKGKGLES